MMLGAMLVGRRLRAARAMLSRLMIDTRELPSLDQTSFLARLFYARPCRTGLWRGHQVRRRREHGPPAFPAVCHLHRADEKVLRRLTSGRRILIVRHLLSRAGVDEPGRRQAEGRAVGTYCRQGQ
jgi:hypothetical protein